MTVYIENEQEKDIKFDYENLLKRIISFTLQRENCPYEAEVSVVITDDTAIRETNREFRGIDKSTDVLSFPMCTYQAPGEFDELEEQEVFHPETGELLLGDIEFAFLTVHSMLNLFG